MIRGILRATWIVSLVFLASCGGSSRPHFAIVALASPQTSPKWVRLDTESGDMIVCTADSRLPESAPPPPAGHCCRIDVPLRVGRSCHPVG
jgi:hypothetical protein